MASIQYVVNAVDSASRVFAKIAASADGLDKQLEDLSKRVATPEVNLEDSKFTLGVLNAAKRLDKLSAMVADPSVDLDAAKAQTEILRINAMLDRLDGKKVTAHVSVDGGRGGGAIDRLLAALTPGAGGAASGLGMAGAGAASATIIGPLLIGVSQVIGALAAAGAGVTAFAALSIPQFTAVSGAVTQISTDTNAYERATTAASKATALKRIKQDWADISPPQRQAVRGIQSLGAEFTKLSNKLAPITFKVFNDGLKIANQLLPDLLPFARAAGRAIDGLLKSLDKFVTPVQQAVKPVGEMGSKLASISAIPPPTGFQKFLTALQALTGPAITALGKGLGQIAGAVGNLIIVSASPDSIRTLSRVLGFMAATINGVAWAVNRASGNMQKWVDIAHQTANKFDEFRHDTARVFAAVATIFDQSRHMVAIWGHDVAHTFDTLRHSVAVTWNAMWAATIGAQIRSLQTIVRWFQSLPGRALAALRGLGHSLYAFAHAALGELWAGFKSVAGGILSWFGGFVSKITGFFSHLLHHSPTGGFYFMGKNMMEGLAMGLKDHAHLVSKAMGGVGGSVGSWIAQSLSINRLPSWWGPLMGILVGKESGGNPRAENPISVLGQHAEGVAQMLPSTFASYSLGGSIWNPVANLVSSERYIEATYGNPRNIAGLLGGTYYGYDQGGWLPPGVTMAVNATGRPERVLPPGRSGGALMHVEHLHMTSPTDFDLLEQKLGFAIVSAGFGGG